MFMEKLRKKMAVIDESVDESKNNSSGKSSKRKLPKDLIRLESMLEEEDIPFYFDMEQDLIKIGVPHKDFIEKFGMLENEYTDYLWQFNAKIGDNKEPYTYDGEYEVEIDSKFWRSNLSKLYKKATSGNTVVDNFVGFGDVFLVEIKKDKVVVILSSPKKAKEFLEYLKSKDKK